MNLQINHSYLIEDTESRINKDILLSITVLNISEKAYLVYWNNGNPLETAINWNSIEIFDKKFKVFEDITGIFNEQTPNFSNLNASEDIRKYYKHSIQTVRTQYRQCIVCKGMKQIPDKNSTSGYTSCPKCNGCGLEREVIEDKINK